MTNCPIDNNGLVVDGMALKPLERTVTYKELETPLTLELDRPSVDAFNRYRAARAAYLQIGNDASITSAELFIDYQWAAFELADALQVMLDTRPA